MRTQIPKITFEKCEIPHTALFFHLQGKGYLSFVGGTTHIFQQRNTPKTFSLWSKRKAETKSPKKYIYIYIFMYHCPSHCPILIKIEKPNFGQLSVRNLLEKKKKKKKKKKKPSLSTLSLSLWLQSLFLFQSIHQKVKQGSEIQYQKEK